MSEAKAWIVIRDDWQQIEFLTEAEAEARREQGCEISSAPKFDAYAAIGEVPESALLAAGWSLECQRCGRRYTADTREDDGAEVERPADVPAEFCSPTCAAESRAKLARIMEVRKEAAEELQRRAPWVTATWRTGSPGCRCYFRDRENQYAQLRYPGEKMRTSTYCHGCKRLVIASCDVEAWEAAASDHGRAKNGEEQG